MKKAIFIIFSILFIFISCIWDSPAGGTLDGYDIELLDIDSNEGSVTIKISGSLSEFNKNPYIYISLQKGIQNLSDEEFEIIEDSDNSVYLYDIKNKEFFTDLENEINNKIIKIKIKKYGDLRVWIYIRAKRVNSTVSDSYLKKIELSFD